MQFRMEDSSPLHPTLLKTPDRVPLNDPVGNTIAPVVSSKRN